MLYHHHCYHHHCYHYHYYHYYHHYHYYSITSLGDYYVNKPSPKYPIGRSRIEALSVLACAVVMIVCSIEVVQGNDDGGSDGASDGCSASDDLHVLW